MFNNLTSKVPTGTTRTGTYRLPAEQEAYLDEFVEWLQSAEGKTRGTAQSYRSHCAKAEFMGLEWKDMTSSIRSAVDALKRFEDSSS